MSGTLAVGFGEVGITPQNPVQLCGYYFDRLSTGVHDPLSARAMAVSDGEKRAVLCVVDLCFVSGVWWPSTASIHEAVAARCGLPEECLMLSATHTHTGPDLHLEPEYAATLPGLIAQAITQAIEDLKSANVSVAHGEEHTLQFIRRYRMKDGSVMTNPGILNPDVVEPIGEPDREVFSLVVTSDGVTRGGLVNFGLHCDTVGGTEISGDWAHYLRQSMTRELGDDATLLTPIACCGDVNHWNVFREVSRRGFEETERIGTTVAGAALASLPQAVPVAPGPVRGLRQVVDAKLRMPTDAELAEAREIMAKPAVTDVDFTMDRVDAIRKISCAEYGPSLPLELSVLAFGNVALVGLPTEFFTALGRNIKERSPFEHTVIVTLAGHDVGYIGERQNYDEGGYEMTSSIVAPGTGERIADTAVDMLKQAHGQMEGAR